MTILVIGAGLAGLRVVEGLRSRGFAGRIVMVGDEAHPPYDRPPLSKELFADESDVRYLRLADTYRELGVEVVLGAPVISLDAERRCAVVRDGTAFEFDDAVIATGAAPRSLPGFAGPGIFQLRTHEDRVHLRGAVEEHGELLVVGAGFLGAEAAASAKANGASVTVLEAQPTPLHAVLGAELGAEVTALHQRHGVDLRTDVRIHSVELRGEDYCLTLGDGSEVQSKAVLVAVGAAPQTAWLDSAGIKVDRGILCDQFGRTSVDAVWAVGDCASWWEERTGAYVRREHWTSAGEQAAVVAANIADGIARHSLVEPAYFWSDQHGVKIQALGDPAPADLVEVVRVGEHGRPLGVFGVDGRVTAVVGFGLPRQVMRCREAVRAGFPVDELLSTLS